MKKFLLFLLLVLVIPKVNAQVYKFYTKYRFVIDEFGEPYPKTKSQALSYTSVHIDCDAKKITVKNKNHGSCEKYYVDATTDQIDGGYSISFYDSFGNEVARVNLNSNDDFEGFAIYNKTNTIMYLKDIE